MLRGEPDPPRKLVPSPAPHDEAKRSAEISDLILFDYLTANHDRWGGNFTNVRTMGQRGPIIAIDNANGFPPRSVRNPHSEAKLAALQRFRKRTVEAIEQLEIQDFQDAVSSDPVGPLLTDAQLQAFASRRTRLLEHVRQMRSEFGERAFPW
jgi:hypothetical protein